VRSVARRVTAGLSLSDREGHRAVYRQLAFAGGAIADQNFFYIADLKLETGSVERLADLSKYFAFVQQLCNETIDALRISPDDSGLTIPV
jgi:hypothetical protein